MRSNIVNMNLISKHLACPKCRINLEVIHDSYYCENCQTQFKKENERVNFLTNPIVHDNDPLNSMKNMVKKFPTIYKILSEVIAPVHVSKKTLNYMIREIDDRGLVGLNIGSGVTNYSSNIINFDAQPFVNVQVLGDLVALPFKDATFDYVFSIYVLEHVPNAEIAIREMHRVLKPGGICYSLIPFIQGFHAAPNDYVRFTSSGVASLFYQFNIVKNKGLGPTSGMLWILQEFIAILLSFNSKRLQLVIHTLIMFITFPIKYADVFLSKNKLAKNIASVNEVIAKKPYALID